MYGFAGVGLHDQSFLAAFAAGAKEPAAEIPARAIANEVTTAAAFRRDLMLDTMVPLLSPSGMKRFTHVNGTLSAERF